jgi:hypothetical protein
VFLPNEITLNKLFERLPCSVSLFTGEELLIKENRQAMCSLCCCRTNPEQLTFTPVAGRVQVSGDLAFEA